jgi:hypothetical protein
MAAVANAIHDAIGTRMAELPMSPPRLLKAILAQSRVSARQAAAAPDAAQQPTGVS